MSLSGSWMKRLSHVRLRELVTPKRSGPILSPCPMVWHAAQCPAKMYCPGSSFTGLASASFFFSLLSEYFQLLSQSPISVARNLGLSVAPLRIHWPVGSLPIRTLGLCPSRSLGSGSVYRPIFLLS